MLFHWNDDLFLIDVIGNAPLLPDSGGEYYHDGAGGLQGPARILSQEDCGTGFPPGLIGPAALDCLYPDPAPEGCLGLPAAIG